MFKINLLVLSLLLVGCNSQPNLNNPATEEISSQALKKTEGLEDCKLYSFLLAENTNPIYIVRCPKTESDSINYMQQQGKTAVQKTVITIDGIEYIQKE